MKFKNIMTFGNASDVLDYCSELEEIQLVDPEIIRDLAHIDDFEGLVYYVVNDCQVLIVDKISGDVYENMTLNVFIRNSIEYAINSD